MILASLQSQTLINWLNLISINEPVQMAAVNYVPIPFERKMDPGDPTSFKLYLQTTKKIDKETDKLDISLSNSKEIVDQFLSLANKYVWGRLAFTLGTSNGAKNILRVAE